MAINPHDDYEALAKLLYPSIEASGNVYYGQTRKLTVDELFDKNNNGFHSHIESQYSDKSKEYDTFFCWELGPLKGIIGVPEVLPTAPMCFAKYKLVFTSKTIENNLYSGTYNSYERNVSAVFISLEKTYGKIPVRGTAWDGANFYIIEEDSIWYLYIAIKHSNIITDLVDPEPYEYTPPVYKEGDEFTLTNLSDDADISVELKLNGSLDNTDVYQYFIVDSSSDWADLVLDTPVTVVGASKIKFRCKPGVIKSDQTSSNFLQLQITGANAALSGDFRSLQENKESVKNFEFSKFLRQNNTIVDARDLVIPIAGFYAFEYLFFTCINLKYPPQLPASTLSHYCYYNMFFNCGSLLVAPELPAVNLMPHCYANMFSGCTQLSRVQDYFKVKYFNSYTLAYSFISMFRNCKSLQVAPCIICDSLPTTSCNGMFYGCTSLKTARVIVTNNLKDDMYSGSNFKRSYCFKDMFKNCTSLTDVYLECPLYTEFETQYVSVGLCQEMFSGCTNLRRIFCYMPQKWISSNDNYTDWLKNVSPVGVFYYDTEYEDMLPHENKFPEGDSGIPSGWERHNIYKKYSNEIIALKFCNEREYVLASGTNNESNGRGDITDPSTLANMEKSFDENNNHPMNTYNTDGSFNQEIWGYKSFCSPVQFRNGIYTDNLAILSTYDSGNFGYHDTDFIVNGSIIKSAKVDGLEIDLKNYKYHNNVDNTESETISFSVPLYGYTNSEKTVNCAASLTSTSDYIYSNESGDESGTVSSIISSTSSGKSANSTIYATISSSGSAVASVDTIISNNEPKVVLNVLDRRNGTTSTSLTISKTGSIFTGDVTATGNTRLGSVMATSISANTINGILPHPQYNIVVPIGAMIPICASSSQLTKMNTNSYRSIRLRFRHVNDESFVIGLYFTFDVNTAIKEPNDNKQYKYSIVNDITNEVSTNNVVFNQEITVPENCYIEFWCNDNLLGSTTCAPYYRSSYNDSPNNVMHFKFPYISRYDSGVIRVSGSLATILTNSTGASNSNIASAAGDYCLSGLFNGCSAILDASELYFADNLGISKGCFYGMFSGCNRLEYPPKILHALTLAEDCYAYMFYGCDLNYAPVLPATTWAKWCYRYMFYNNTGMQYVICSSDSSVSDVISPTLDWLENDYPDEASEYPITVYINNTSNINLPSWSTVVNATYSDHKSAEFFAGANISTGNVIVSGGTVYVVNICAAMTVTDGTQFNIEYSGNSYPMYPEYKFALISDAKMINSDILIAYVMRIA